MTLAEVFERYRLYIYPHESGDNIGPEDLRYEELKKSILSHRFTEHRHFKEDFDCHLTCPCGMNGWLIMPNGCHPAIEFYKSISELECPLTEEDHLVAEIIE